jgi:hypothetical protein
MKKKKLRRRNLQKIFNRITDLDEYPRIDYMKANESVNKPSKNKDSVS